MNVNELVQRLKRLPPEERLKSILAWDPDSEKWEAVTVIVIGLLDGVRLYTDADE